MIGATHEAFWVEGLPNWCREWRSGIHTHSAKPSFGMFFPLFGRDFRIFSRAPNTTKSSKIHVYIMDLMSKEFLVIPRFITRISAHVLNYESK
ncbi:hypothetical protein Syun_001549 [Stephania yunnanensis]|uniref:Uncharacterized protein n=1 Tax=Stephania yunnanensis TaxID=152371 RepID=A0AAP0LI18_9MAGN